MGNTIKNTPAGLPDFGYSEQAEWIGIALVQHPDAKANRDTLRALLDQFEQPMGESDESIDRVQDVADRLTDLCRASTAFLEGLAA